MDNTTGTDNTGTDNPTGTDNTAGTDNGADTETLRKDLDQLRKDVRSLSNDVKNDYRGQIEAGMNKARSRAGDLCGEIESRPFTSIVTAFSVGLLAGALFRR